MRTANSKLVTYSVRMALVAWLTVTASGRCLGQHADIEFEVVDGEIVLPDGVLYSSFLLGDGFPPMPGPPPTQTNEPGFEAPDGALPAGTAVGLRVTQPLHYWNSTAVANPSPIETIFRLQIAGGSLIDVDRRGVPDINSFDFAVAGAEGGVHRDLDWILPEATAPAGAYGVVLQLTAPGLTASRPFLVVFGQQIDAAELADASQAMLAASGVDDGALAADFNLDGEVSGVDLTSWRLGNGAASHALLADGDADRDGDVDGADLLAWQRGLTPPADLVADSSMQGSVPEPRGATLAMVLAAMALARYAPWIIRVHFVSLVDSRPG